MCQLRRSRVRASGACGSAGTPPHWWARFWARGPWAEAKTEGRVAVNAATREVSVTTVEGTEEANSAVLTT